MFDFALATLWGGAVWILGIALKGTVVLLLVLSAAAALRRASAGQRHLVWSGGIVALLLVPLVSVALPWELELVPVPASVAPVRATRTVGSVEPEAALHVTDREPAIASPGRMGRSTERVSPPTGSRLAGWLLALWGAGVVFFLGRLALGAILLRRVVRRATALDSPDWTHPLIEGADRLALDRLPRLVTSRSVQMPVLCGVLNPAIVVPADALEWSERRRRAVLCHELAHIRRLDLPMNLLGRVACALHWFNPLAWTAARRLRAESERAADDLVLGVGTRPSEYADHLLQIVCGARHSQAPEVAIPMAQRREFEGRMLAILDRDARREPPSLSQAAALTGLVLLLLLPIAALGAAPVTFSEAPAESSGSTGSGAESEDSGPDMLTAVLAGLEDPRASQRRDAANLLGTLEASSAVEALARHLRSDADSVVRATAAWALGQIASPEAVEPLAGASGDDVSEEVRAMSVWALGQVGEGGALPALIGALRDASGEVRTRAAWAIGTIAPARAPADLIEALHDDDTTVGEYAAWALGQIGDPSAVPALAALAEEEGKKVSMEAAWSLTLIGGEEARPTLLKLLQLTELDVKLNDNIRRALAGESVAPRPREWPIPTYR